MIELYKHKWEYERHNTLILRSCDCGIVEEGTLIEEPELTATSPIRKSDFNKIKWKKV